VSGSSEFTELPQVSALGLKQPGTGLPLLFAAIQGQVYAGKTLIPMLLITKSSIFLLLACGSVVAAEIALYQALVALPVPKTTHVFF